MGESTTSRRDCNPCATLAGSRSGLVERNVPVYRCHQCAARREAVSVPTTRFVPMDTSVIIATYNHGAFVKEAIDSVLRQRAEGSLEVLVVDDGSTDQTPDVLRTIKDPRVRCFRIPNSGGAAARNEALAHASGDFVGFLDADDRWLPGKLERQLALLGSEPEVGFVFSDFRRFDEEGVFPKTHFDFVPSFLDAPTRASRAGGGRVLLGDTFMEYLRAEIFPTWLQTLLVRAELVDDLRFDTDLGRAEDVDFMTRLCARATAAYLTEPTAELRRHGSNKTSDHGATERAYVNSLLAAKDGLRSHLETTPSHRRALDHEIGRAWARVGYLAFHQKRPGQSAEFYLRALRHRGVRSTAVKHLLALPLVPWLARPDEVGWE